MNILGGVESSARYGHELRWRYMPRDKARNRCRIWLRMVIGDCDRVIGGEWHACRRSISLCEKVKDGSMRSEGRE